MKGNTKGTGLAMFACLASVLVAPRVLASGSGPGPEGSKEAPAQGASVVPPADDVAAALSSRWEGKALRIEGAGDLACVRYSTSKGRCLVYRRGADGALTSFAGTCALTARGRKTTYLALSCRTGGTLASGGALAESCVPGRSFIVFNMTAAFSLSGDEQSVGDASLPRRARVAGTACDARTLADRAVAPGADEGKMDSDATGADGGKAIPAERAVAGNGTGNGNGTGSEDGFVSLRARGDAKPSAAGGRHDRVSKKLARLEGAGARDAKGLVPPSQLPEAQVTETLNAKWNGRAVEMDTGSVVYCVNFSRAKGSCTAFFKDKATQAVQGPSSGDCSVRASQGNAALAFSFLSGKELRTYVVLRSAVAGHEEAFPGRNGQDFWRLRDRPCLSSNF